MLHILHGEIHGRLEYGVEAICCQDTTRVAAEQSDAEFVMWTGEGRSYIDVERHHLDVYAFGGPILSARWIVYHIVGLATISSQVLRESLALTPLILYNYNAFPIA